MADCSFTCCEKATKKTIYPCFMYPSCIILLRLQPSLVGLFSSPVPGVRKDSQMACGAGCLGVNRMLFLVQDGMSALTFFRQACTCYNYHLRDHVYNSELVHVRVSTSSEM